MERIRWKMSARKRRIRFEPRWKILLFNALYERVIRRKSAGSGNIM